MAQDGQTEQPPSAEDKKVTEGGTLTAVAEAETPAAETETPAVAESSSKFAANLEVKRPELKPGDQLPLFDFENEGVGITPVSVSTDLKSDITTPSLTDTSKGPAVAAVAGSGTAVAEEEVAEKPATEQNPDIAPIGEPTAEEKAKAKQNNTGPVVQPKANENAPAEQEAEAEEPIKDVRYRGVFAAKSMSVLNEVWGVGEVSDELKEAMGLTGKVKKNDKYGLDFHMPNGHVIEWHANLGGAEFIGMRKRTSKFDEDDAHSVAVTAKARGWTAINVHGNQKQKEMMWLHAKMNGLEVANFEPMYDNDPNNVRNRLAAHLAKQNDGEVIGATPVQQQMNLSGGVPDHEQTSRDGDEPETPADTAKADAGKPVTEKPVTEKPATDKPAENVAVAETAAAPSSTTPAAETTAKPEAAAAEGGEVKTAFGKIDPPAAKGEGDGSKIDKNLVKSLAEEVRAANPDNPEAEQSLAAVDKAMKGKDGVAPAVTDIANEKGVALETADKPEKGTPAVADTSVKPAKTGGAKPPKRGR